MKSYLLFGLFIFLFTSCTKDIVENVVTDTIVKDTVSNDTIVKVTPKACFEYTRSSIISALDTVQFSNCSSNSDLYKWDFGDGTSSIEKNPIHIYKTKGIFKVKLLATKVTDSDTISKSINIPYYVDGQIIILNKLLEREFGFSSLSSIDIEGDGNNDLFLNYYCEWYHSYSKSLTNITSDNYEIIQDQYYEQIFNIKPKTPYTYSTVQYDTIVQNDTLAIPKIYSFGNTIKNQLGTYKHLELILSNYYRTQNTNRYNPYGTYYSCNILIKNEVRYIGFQKRYGNTVKIGWLKLKVLGNSNIELISYMVPKETESLIIDK